jgi:hypothetical protein
VLASTPNGLDGAFWECATIAEKSYAVFHAPTAMNPFLPPAEIAYLRSTLRPEVASQELDAQFVDTSGAAIFPLANLLIDGEPHPDDFRWTYIGCAIDSNSGKGGPDRDGCAAVIFALTSAGRVVVLDWDIRSLAQGGIVDWLEHIRGLAMGHYYRLQPGYGAPEAWIEPAGNAWGIIEAARERGFCPNELDSNYVAMGKDGRAISVEPHVAQGNVKLSAHALDKRTNYRGITANHMTRQVCGFHAFDKEAYKREDDLFDAFTYSVLKGLGDGAAVRWDKLKRVA